MYIVFGVIKQSFVEEALEESDPVDAQSDYASVRERDAEHEVTVLFKESMANGQNKHQSHDQQAFASLHHGLASTRCIN